MTAKTQCSSIRALFGIVALFLPLTVGQAGAMNQDGNAMSDHTAPSGLEMVQAVRSALADNLDGRLSAESIVVRDAVLQQARSIFDPVISASVSRSRDFTPLSESDKSSYTGGRRIVDSTGYNIAYNRLLRSGITLRHEISYEKADENFETKADIPNRGRVSSGVTIPLRKGRNRTAVAAEVLAAELEMEAESLQHAHVLSSIAATTAKAYWDYLAVIAQEKVYHESVARARKLLEDTKHLVDADEVPRAELDGLKANLAQKTAISIGAEKSVTGARHTLALLMGLHAHEIDSLPAPSGSFPEWDSMLAGMKFQRNRLALLALRNRNDFKARKRLLEAAEKRVLQARDNLRPDFNVELDVGFSGYENSDRAEAMWRSLYDNREGIDISAQIVYRWPVKNNEADGAYRSMVSARESIDIETEKMERQIRSNVQVSLSELLNSIRQLHEINRSLQLYEKAVEGERSKFSLGVSTLLDVVQIEDRLTDAYVQMISAQQAYAATLIDFRLVLGLLISVSNNEVSIRSADFHVLPYEDIAAMEEGEQP